MKRLIIILAVVPLLFTSCTKDPYADFVTSTLVAEVGETVSFTNRSLDANSYEWDFGDGYYSTTLNAAHEWLEPGTYEVALTAYGKDGRIDIGITDIVVRYLYTADIEITVEEYDDPYYIVEEISVRLYSSVLDWEEEYNMLVEGYTGGDGTITFLNVPLPYNRRVYVDVYGPFHDNYQLASEDVGWIETDVLVPDALNYFTAVVDYYPDGKKSATSRKDIKAVYKAEANEITRIPAERENIDKGVQGVR